MTQSDRRCDQNNVSQPSFPIGDISDVSVSVPSIPGECNQQRHAQRSCVVIVHNLSNTA